MSNDFGTVVSRIDILRAVTPGQRCSTVPYVKPGGEILLRLSGWPKVERVLQLIDAVEALGIDPADVAPDYWHHAHNRLSVNETPRPTHEPPPGLASSAEGYVMSARCRTFSLTSAATALLLSTIGRASPRYIWNASNSVPDRPLSLAACDSLTRHRTRCRSAARTACHLPDLNGYLPIGVPMLKRVLALPGQTVCRIGTTISVDGIEVGEAQGARRTRPAACRSGKDADFIGEGELFLMNWQSADLLDSRYFGPLPASAMIGRALPVWTDAE